MSVVCFGDVYSHTYAAASALMRRAASQNETVRCCESVQEVLAAVESERATYGVVPIENSFEGTVTAVCDGLRALHLYIVDEIVLPIRQNLIALEGVKAEEIDCVLSHPQALAQCRASLERLVPHAARQAVAYTSAGLLMLNEHTAAIARAPKDGQVILAADIQDSPHNCTRFVRVASHPVRTGDKVSVTFSTEDAPGALLGALHVLARAGCNMTKIESRPRKERLGQYVFFVDFLLPTDVAPSEVLSSLEDAVTGLQFLGRYASSDTQSKA